MSKKQNTERERFRKVKKMFSIYDEPNGQSFFKYLLQLIIES